MVEISVLVPYRPVLVTTALPILAVIPLALLVFQFEDSHHISCHTDTNALVSSLVSIVDGCILLQAVSIFCFCEKQNSKYFEINISIGSTFHQQT